MFLKEEIPALNEEFNNLVGRKFKKIKHKKIEEGRYLLHFIEEKEVYEFLLYYEAKDGLPSLEGSFHMIEALKEKEIEEMRYLADGLLKITVKAGEGRTQIMSYINIVDVTFAERV